MGHKPGLGGGARAVVECSAHLLPCGSGWQDVELGELSRVFLGLEAQRGNTGGPAVRRGRRSGDRGRSGVVGEDGPRVGGALHGRGGLAEESRSGGSTGQGTHTGEEPGRRTEMSQKCKSMDDKFSYSFQKQPKCFSRRTKTSPVNEDSHCPSHFISSPVCSSRSKSFLN